MPLLIKPTLDLTLIFVEDAGGCLACKPGMLWGATVHCSGVQLGTKRAMLLALLQHNLTAETQVTTADPPVTLAPTSVVKGAGQDGRCLIRIERQG